MKEIQEKSTFVQVSARFELANIRFKLARVNCQMKKIRKSLFSCLHFQVHIFGCLPPIFLESSFLGLCSGLRSSVSGLFVFATTINSNLFKYIERLTCNVAQWFQLLSIKLVNQ